MANITKNELVKHMMRLPSSVISRAHRDDTREEDLPALHAEIEAAISETLMSSMRIQTLELYLQMGLLMQAQATINFRMRSKLGSPVSDCYQVARRLKGFS